MASLDDVYCNHCGSVGYAKKRARGEGWITMVLLFFCVLPGLIHWLWRMTHRERSCPDCGSTDVLPADSPRAKDAIKTRFRT